jgi:hypothetical protein
VTGALDLTVEDIAFRQRCLGMGAPVTDGVEPIAVTEEGDPLARHLHPTP